MPKKKDTLDVFLRWAPDILCRLFSMLPIIGMCLMIYILLPSTWLLGHDRAQSMKMISSRRESKIPSHVQTSRSNPGSIRKPLGVEDPQMFLRKLGLGEIPDMVDLNTTWVHILTYPEGGLDGAILGAIFNKLSDVFFIPQPLALLYPALFGSDPHRPDNAVPYNIHYDHTAHRRRLSEGEAITGFRLLHKIFMCQMRELPTAVLLNPYWETISQSASPKTKVHGYVNCLRKKGVRMSSTTSSLSFCNQYIAKVCPPTFTTNPSMAASRIQSCSKVLYSEGRVMNHVDNKLFSRLNSSDPISRAQKRFSMYFTCLQSYEQKARTCASQYLDTVCEKASTKIVTTQRSSNFITNSLLQMQPNSKLIHIVRDPRAVGYRRSISQTPDSDYGYFEHQDPTVLAKTYCELAFRHIGDLKLLKEENPNQVIGISYEKLLHHISENFFYLLRYFKVSQSNPETMSLMEYLKDIEMRLIKENYQWSVAMPPSEILAINHICDDLLNEIANAETHFSKSKTYFI